MSSTLNRWIKRQSKNRTPERRTAMPAPPRKTDTRTRAPRAQAAPVVNVTTGNPLWWVLVALVVAVGLIYAAMLWRPQFVVTVSVPEAVQNTQSNETVEIADTTTGPTGVTGDGTVEETNNDGASNNNGDGVKLHGSGTLPNPVSTWNQGSWEVSEFRNLQGNPIVVSWINRLKDPAPGLWPTYPNVRNPEVSGFKVVECDNPATDNTCVPDGMEYGVPDVPFCQQDSRCDFIVPAWHYRLITADYGFLNLTCQGEGEKGCLLLLINVMDQSYTWRDQMADNGFTVPGRYWNGDALEWGVWGLVSHASANMLNMPTQGLLHEVLNASGGANAGANCGHPEGCDFVDATVVVHAGDEVLAVLHTEVR